MKISEVLSPVSGIFSNMPQDVWGVDLDPTHLDIELFTRIGGLEAAPLLRHFIVDGVLDTHGLAQLLHQRYASNWKHVWAALKLDYEVFITSTTDETRTITRDKSDTETRALTDRILEGGVDATKDTFDEHNASDTTLTKSGSEDRSTTDTQTRAGTSADTGTDTNAKATGIYGVGGTGVVNQSTETDTETRDLHGTTSENVDGTTQDNLTFTNRTDRTTDATSHTGSNDRRVTYGKTTEAGKTGTVGTVGSETETETFHSEGSSPLRTFQALIQEELDGRTGQSWNFTELVIRDVQAMIASMIWRRNCG